MVKITEQLIRKKSEHNELLIFSLEEISLHQENIESIDCIQDFCRELRILLLQSNLISKIENLNKLKKLEYLNLAINNIEKIENLVGCESLQKLDLTLNFIGDLTSVESLQKNIHLRDLYLTGNPCTDYPSYRDYVIVALPQLTSLDGREITRTERFKAQKSFEMNRRDVIQLQAKYQISRDEQKLRVENEIQTMANADLDDEEKLKEFWNMKSENCPEIRREIAEKSRRKSRDNQVNLVEKNNEKFTPKLFAKCGRPYCLNFPKLDFSFHDETDRYELDLHVYKFLDTSLIVVDVQPNYVRVTVKGKFFQMALKDEVRIDEATSKRSQTTGHLLIVTPKLNVNNYVSVSTLSEKSKKQSTLKESVNIRDIIPDTLQDDSEIPPLI
ncbi:CLUMA_CG007548, isoform A [Clunio marinus]|uniref:CLUMA_CG007548, isoform A n=1 Tax=Clunio marinus TaxID=568069 RepID=A0A1J1I100_9DIPT|nr:CLUMA_CG007548, isoform A [Clunio marinus]